MQSGRWLLFQTGSLTGTNMLLRRAALEEPAAMTLMQLLKMLN